MKRKFLILPSLFLLSQIISFSQGPGSDRISVIGWADDTHYILRSVDSNSNTIIQSVDVKSGKAVPFRQAQPGSNLSESAPNVSFSAISEDQQSAIVIRDNDLYLVQSGVSGQKRLTNDNIPEINPRFSPDGSKIAYTKNKDLYVYDLIQGREIRLTTDATERIYNGYASWVYMEEILGRASHYAAFWWSPDGSRIAYLRTDETDVPVFTLNRLDENDGIHGTLEVTPYPKSGDPNPKVKMGIAEIQTARTTWVKTDYNTDQYLAWPFWTPDSRLLAIQVINRDQNQFNIILADPQTGDFKNIYEERNKTWVEFREDIEVLKNGSGYIIRSYRNGWENLYLAGWDGKLTTLTNFNFRVTSIDRIDENAKTIYFSATGAESTDEHSFRVGLDGSNLFRMTSGPGTHSVFVSPGGSYYIDTWSTISDPGSIIAYDRKGKKLRDIHVFTKPAGDVAYTEMVKIKTSDNLFNMPATITYPPGFDKSRKYPVIFSIYGGPDSRNVYNRWSRSDSWYTRNGIVVFKVDHRGSGQFGKEGLDYLYRSLGKWEILDYEDAVKWLRQQPWADPSRIGITGSSYGGYMTCLALTKGAGFWTHGFAVSSVTDWRLYDNVYTERFMDKPEDNPGGYSDGSVLPFVKNYTGKLYISHGDIDDNVHLQNSIYLISKLQDEGKDFEMMLFPGERHGQTGKKGIHWRNEEYKFWLRNFFGK
ncbi:MAG TPA: DPP IV N-terminal domain-containing protein [Bacteroidales bacterium]|nr:DPP IV N-terminal domain-containing protein [Bacteroidales bacterium]